MRLYFIAVLLLMLCSGGPFTRAAKVFEVEEGQDVRIKCYFYTSGHWRVFCKNRCDTRADFLVSTFLDVGNSGRYSIEYEQGLSYPNVMYVSIQNVRSSDAGSYCCAMTHWEETGAKNTFVDVIIHVNAVSSRSAAGIPFLELPSASEPHQDHTPQSDVALYVALTVSALLILSVTFTVLYWKKRGSTPRDPPQTPGYAQILESTHEEISSDTRGAPAEMSSVSFSNTTHSCDVNSQ